MREPRRADRGTLPIGAKWLTMSAVLLAGCSGAGESGSATPIAEAQALKPEQLEAKANEISQNDYRMFRSLMALGGLDQALGGASQGDAALRGLMLQFRQQMLGARADLPRLMKVQGSSDAPGLTGLGASFFIGLLSTKAMVSVSSSAGVPNGDIGGSQGGGAFAGSFDQEKVSSSSTFSGEIGGMNGRITTKIALNMCPKPDGAVTVELLSDSSLTKVGGTASANVKITGKVTMFVNDDAEFGDDFNADIRVENAAFGGARGANGSYVDYSEKTSTVAANNQSVFNRASSKATNEDAQTAQAAAKLARLLLMSAALEAKDAFQSGQCVKLEPTSDPAKRNGVKPSTSFALLAAPRSKSDGTPTGGTVQATLTGEGKLDPVATKVPADAKFTYVAPDAKDKKGSVAFQARSKRGVGKAMLDFDTKNRAYSATGGGGDFRGTGKICSLAAPFTISGMGITNTFTPTSEAGGSYSYSGNSAGVRLFGKGTYSVKVDESGGTITATGPGSIVSPMGTFSGTGTETYTLTPLADCG